MNDEIERKYRMSKLPADLDESTAQFIRQGYLCLEDEREVRVRSKGDGYYLTVKQGVGVRRGEAEIEINREQFETLWPMTGERRLVKTRYRYPWEGHVIEIDVYHEQLAPLILAEIEFESIETADAFGKPDFLDEEVTELAVYRNMNLVVGGIPVGDKQAG